MHQVLDSAAPGDGLAKATGPVLPSTSIKVSARGNGLLSELNFSAYVYPCRCYTHGVATVSVRLRASVSG